jgi:hypothetical protein
MASTWPEQEAFQAIIEHLHAENAALVSLARRPAPSTPRWEVLVIAPHPEPADVAAAQVSSAEDGLGNGSGSGARAYCGELHGRRWSVPADRPPPVVRLRAGDSAVAYRWVLYPRSDRPARNHRGNYAYVPLTYPLRCTTPLTEARRLPRPNRFPEAVTAPR